MMRQSAAVTRLLRRHRRGVAAVLAGLSVLVLGVALRPPTPATAPVVVAARDLPTGHRIEVPDLARGTVALGASGPGTTADPQGLVGRVLAAPLARGEAVTALRLMTPPGAAWATPAGTTPLPVRFSDGAAVALLSAGQRVDVLAASAPVVDDATMGLLPARVVARDALVLAVTGPDLQGADGLLDAGPGADQAPLVVLAVSPGEALAVAGARAGSELTFALRVDPG